MIIRRIKRGTIIKPIEIIPIETLSQRAVQVMLSSSNAIKIQYIGTDKGDELYDVELPEGLEVKPADLRYMAYDHEQVEKLVAQCVRDNLRAFVCRPRDDAFFEDLNATLTEALRDLLTLIDLVSVERHTQEEATNEYYIDVIYEEKNGARQQLRLPVSENNYFSE